MSTIDLVSLVLKVRTLLAACLRPSGVMLATASFVVASFIVWLLLLTPKTMDAALAAYPGFAKLGDRAFLFHHLTQLRENQSNGTVRIAIMGASTTRESIWTPELFAERASARLGRPVSAVVLTSPGQRLLFSWSLVEQTLCNGFDAAVVGVNMGLFTKEAGNNPARYIGYHASTVDAYLGESPTTTGWFLFDNTPFVVGTLYVAAHAPLSNLVGDSRMISRKNPYKTHRFVGKAVKPPAKVMKKLERVSHKYGKMYPKESATNFALLEGMVETANKCGGELVLMDTPRHPWLLNRKEFRAYQVAFDAHEAALTKFAEKHSLALIDPNKIITYTPSDTNDGGHLRLEATIRKTTEAIADAVAKQILRKRGDREVSAIQ